MYSPRDVSQNSGTLIDVQPFRSASVLNHSAFTPASSGSLQNRHWLQGLGAGLGGHARPQDLAVPLLWDNAIEVFRHERLMPA